MTATKSNIKPFADSKQINSGQITCYNCNKEEHIFRDYIKPKKQKTSYNLGNFNINNCKSGSQSEKGLITFTLCLVSDLVPWKIRPRSML